jgi:hypothetical protein
MSKCQATFTRPDNTMVVCQLESGHEHRHQWFEGPHGVKWLDRCEAMTGGDKRCQLESGHGGKHFWKPEDDAAAHEHWGPNRVPAAALSEEKVDHPVHYGGADNPYEVIKVLDAWGLGFCLGNAVKYIARAGKKDATLLDLAKARWYIQHEIERLMAKEKAKEKV